MNCGSPGSSVHGISQARILGWFAISFPRGSFLPRGWACVSCIGRQSLYHLTTREAILRYLQAPNWGLPWWLSWLRIFLRWRIPGFDPRVGKIPWRRERLPTPVFWPGEFHGLYNPWGHKEPDTTERLSLSNVTDRFFFFTMLFALIRSPGEGNGYPLQCSGLENSTDRGTWWATGHGVARR